RDAAGQPADRLHLRRLAKPRLEARALGLGELALGNVAQVDDQRPDRRIIEQVGSGDLQPAMRAVAMLDQEFTCDDISRRAQSLVTQCQRGGPLLRMDVLEELPAA